MTNEDGSTPDQPTVGVKLRSVFPVASNDLGFGTRVVSVEIYDRGLILRWLAAPPPLDFDPISDEHLFQVSDDVGTRYQYVSGGAFGHADALRGDSMYVPAPPDHAKRLDLFRNDSRVSVRLA